MNTDPAIQRRDRKYVKRASSLPVKPPLRAVRCGEVDGDDRMARSVASASGPEGPIEGVPFSTAVRNARGSSTIATTIVACAGAVPGEPGVAALEQWMTQFLYGQVNSRELIDADSWRLLSAGMGDVLASRQTLEKVRQLVGKLANHGAVIAVRRMTSRAIADRIRAVLIGPPSPETPGATHPAG